MRQCPNDVLKPGQGFPTNPKDLKKVESQAVLIESKLRLAFDFDEIRPGHPGCGRDDWKTR